MLRLARVFWLWLGLLVCDVLAWDIPADGYASMTHYDLPALVQQGAEQGDCCEIDVSALTL